jgi:tetratricopeptide (TPR) repeat protein
MTPKDKQRTSIKLKLFTTIFIPLFLIGCGQTPEEALEKGFLLYDEGSKVEAYPYLDKAYKSGIEHPELITRLAYCKVAIDNDPSAAIVLLQEGVVKYPNHASIYNMLGLIAQQYGQEEDNSNLQQAIYFARKAVKHDPDDFEFMSNLASYLFLAGDMDSSLTCFQRAHELNTTDKETVSRISQLEQIISERQ